MTSTCERRGEEGAWLDVSRETMVHILALRIGYVPAICMNCCELCSRTGNRVPQVWRRSPGITESGYLMLTTDVSNMNVRGTMQIYLQDPLIRAPGPRFAGRCVPAYSIDVTVSLARNMMLLNALSVLLSPALPQPDGGYACSLMNS